MDHSEAIGNIVLEAAYDIFCTCQAESDFCVQTTGMQTVVFGGSNRLIWTPRGGFRPDRSYCTQRFLALYDSSAD